jgi:hypothetical protein
MRLRSACVARGLARICSGSARSAVVSAPELAKSAAYTPCSRRYQPLLSALFSDTVAISASSRAPATVPAAGATTSSIVPSGGNSLATALSLNARLHRAKSVLHRCGGRSSVDPVATLTRRVGLEACVRASELLHTRIDQDSGYGGVAQAQVGLTGR